MIAWACRCLGLLTGRLAWCEGWLPKAVEALDGERFWYPEA